jgi:hypothetical protein
MPNVPNLHDITPNFVDADREFIKNRHDDPKAIKMSFDYEGLLIGFPQRRLI